MGLLQLEEDIIPIINRGLWNFPLCSVCKPLFESKLL